MSTKPYIPSSTTSATICSISELETIASTVTRIVVGSNCGNENPAPSLFFSRFTQLKEIVVGDNACMYVDQLDLNGLPTLESVMIGENSFTKKRNGYGQEGKRRLSLKNCPMMRELKVGRYSFSDYYSASIENNNALEVIEMGELSQTSNNFYSGVLQLTSGFGQSE